MAEDPPENDENKEEAYPLSAAFLAPLNSIFEAQIHAARSFLNLLLKMGFRHNYSESDIAEFERGKVALEAAIASEKKKAKAARDTGMLAAYEEQLTEIKAALDEKDANDKAKKKMRQLFKKRNSEEGLTADEIADLKELNAHHGDLYQQSIDFINNDGNQVTVNIPNLALLPIKPLTITDADFSFDFKTQYAQEWKTKDDGERKRPWYLIGEPKSLRGNIVTNKGEGTESSIKVNMKIAATQMPAGLEKLMVHLTNTIESVDTDETDDYDPDNETPTT